MSSFQYPPKPQNDNQPLTTIKIFLASSSELKEDREQFEIFINRKNKQYIKKGIFLELVLWEDFIDSMSRTRLQDEYNKAIIDCDIFVSLFFTKVGKYTEEEFLKAWETFKVNDNPLIFTYFKDADIKTSKIEENDILSLFGFKKKLNEKGHYPTNYENINNLKNHFSDQLIKLLPKLKEKKIYLASNKANIFIDKLMSSYESLESKKISNLLIGLSSIIAQINPENIQRAYQNSLPPDAELWNLQSNDIAAILNKLNEFRRLADFVKQLTQDTDIAEELRGKLKHYAEKLPQKKSQEDNIEKPPNDVYQQLESFVIFTLKSINNKDKFLLNSWLIINDSERNNPKDFIPPEKFISLIKTNEVQPGKYCKFSEIPLIVDELLQNGLDHILGKTYTNDAEINLVIEFFLPKDLMLTGVDRWLINDGLGDIILGRKYAIRLRSLERLEKPYLRHYFGHWKKNWNNIQVRFNDQRVFKDFEHIQDMKDFNGEFLKDRLKKKIGLKVTCAPPQSKIEELFIAILRSATPVAIWTRRDLADCDCLTVIDDFLKCKLLSNLCESVRVLRDEVHGNPEHFSSHLSILWEDPYRLTPDVMVELIEAGK